MKKAYLLLLLLTFIFNVTYGQKSNKDDARFHLGKVSKNITEGIKAYNLEDLKYHAQISKDAAENVEKLVEAEQCYNTLDLTDSIIIYLETALLAEELNSARTYLNKTEELILKAFYEYDMCSSGERDQEDISLADNSSDALTHLKKQQADLVAQQAALEQKTKDIKARLAKQEEQKIFLQKERFIASSEMVITNSLKAYNDLLKSCDCQTTVSNTVENKSILTTKNLQQIKMHYLERSIEISENYTSKLKACKK